MSQECLKRNALQRSLYAFFDCFFCLSILVCLSPPLHPFSELSFSLLPLSLTHRHTQKYTLYNSPFSLSLSCRHLLSTVLSTLCPLMPFQKWQTRTRRTHQNKGRYTYACMRVNTDNPQRSARTVVHSVPSPA